MLTAKPSTSWLDRLRSAKGIPVNNDLDLEQFLNQNPNSDSNSAQLVPNHKQKAQLVPNSDSNSSKDHRNEEKWFSTMSSVLAELFVMEDSSSESQKKYKKSSRKQAKPKICVFSSSASVDGNGEGKAEGVSAAMSPSSAENSVAVVKEIGDQKIDEEDKSKLDFSGYSRSDVMIIDTSSVVWKTEKLVLRKGNVWKVREKNSKSRSFSRFRKKRKFNQFDMDSGDEKKRKKKKKLKKKKQKALLAPLSIGNREDEDKCGGFPFKVYPQNDNQVASKKTQHNLDQVPKKSNQFFRPPGKSFKRRSVFHVQNAPTGR